MNKKNLSLILVLLLMASVTVWAQGINPITPNGLPNESADSNAGHMQHGCHLCHVPHTTGTIEQPGAGLSISATAAYNLTGAAATGVQGAGVGLPNAGTIYLWGQSLSPFTYNTWDNSGGQLSASGLKASSPAVHSIMCLSCHDCAVSGSAYDVLGSLGGPGTFGTNNIASFNPNTSAVADTCYVGGATNNGWGACATGASPGLVTDHPVHALYPVKTTDNNYGLYWTVTINAATASTPATVSFTDASFIPYTGGAAYAGHPGKLYTDGNFAYVECTSCHEPHRFEHVAYQTQGTAGTWVVDPGGLGAAPTTVDYIRGPYNIPGNREGGNVVANGEQNAGFCRSCHYDKSANYINNGGGVD